MDYSKELLGQLLGGDTVNALSTSTGASATDVKKVLSAAVPILVAGMHDEAGTSTGEAALTKALSDHAGDDTGDITAFLSNIDTADSKKILSYILPDQQQNATKAIAKKAGVSTNQTLTILLALAPLLLTLLGKQNEHTSDSTGTLLGSLLGGDGGGNLLGSLLGAGGSGSGNLAGTLVGALLHEGNGSNTSGGLLGSLLGGGSSNGAGGLLGSLVGNGGGLLGSLIGEDAQQEASTTQEDGGLLGGLLGSSGGGLLGSLFGDDSQVDLDQPKKKTATKKVPSATAKKASSASGAKKKTGGSASAGAKKKTAGSSAGAPRKTGTASKKKKNQDGELAGDVLNILGKLLK